MKVLLLAWDLDPSGGHGGATHVWETVQSLCRGGHNVLLVSQPPKKPLPCIKGLSEVFLPAPSSGLLRTLTLFLYGALLTPLLLLIFIPDVIWERARIFGGLGVLWSPKVFARSVYEMNEPVAQAALMHPRVKRSSLFFKALKKWHFFTARQADVITLTHPSMARGLPKNKCALIHYGANPARFKPRAPKAKFLGKHGLQKDKTVLYAGSFRPWHELEAVVNAALLMQKKFPGLKWVLLGDGDEHSTIQRLVKEKNLENIVLLPGKIPYEEMSDWLDASTVCLALFSKNYPLFKLFSYFYSPIKVHEYRACGKAVVATDLGNLSTIVQNKKGGLLVKKNSPQEIARAVGTLLANPAMREKIAKHNRKEAEEKYNWDTVTRLVLSELERRT